MFWAGGASNENFHNLDLQKCGHIEDRGCGRRRGRRRYIHHHGNCHQRNRRHRELKGSSPPKSFQWAEANVRGEVAGEGGGAKVVLSVEVFGLVDAASEEIVERSEMIYLDPLPIPDHLLLVYLQIIIKFRLLQ